MLVTNSRLIGTLILSVQAGGPVGHVDEAIVDPDSLKILGFLTSGPLIPRNTPVLDVRSIREYSTYGMVIDNVDELAAKDDIIKIQKILSFNFNPIGLKVETKKGKYIGRVIDFTATHEDFYIQQIIVKRPIIKSFVDPELTISKKEIVEITDYKIIVKDEEKVLKARAEKEDFIPNFVNPFRKSEQDFAPAQTKTPADKDS